MLPVRKFLKNTALEEQVPENFRRFVTVMRNGFRFSFYYFYYSQKRV